jgi:hypothetical protein
VLPADLVRQLLQTIFATGDQEDAVPASGQLASELGADSARGARDQAGRGGIGCRERHDRRAYPFPQPTIRHMTDENPFGGLFGDPEDMQKRLSEFAEQMQGAQRVAWADNAIKLAVDMTVAAIQRLDLNGSADEQAAQVRDAIRLLFPEAVTLVREAREGLA